VTAEGGRRVLRPDGDRGLLRQWGLLMCLYMRYEYDGDEYNALHSARMVMFGMAWCMAYSAWCIRGASGGDCKC
jgi:hypothetical protein